MKIELRHIVAVSLLLFAWKGNELSLPWPPAGTPAAVAPEPPKEALAWAADVKAITPKMLPTDRTYYSDFYEGLAFVLLRDKARGDDKVIQTTEDFSAFHGGSLAAAVDKSKVGAYPGLDVAIDKVFFTALGTDEPRKMTAAEQDALIAACGVLSHVFRIGGDG